MTERAAGRRQIEEALEEIQQALAQQASSDKLERVQHLLTLARDSLDIDLNHPIEHRDAVLAAARVMETEFGERAVPMANLIQAKLGNRAFNKCVAHTTRQLKWFREKTNLIAEEDGQA